MDRNGNNLPAPLHVVDFSLVRTSLAAPTLIAAIIAERAGAHLDAVRPGTVLAHVSKPDVRVRVRVSRKNIYRDEAKAYRLAGLPVPEHVLRDADHWERTFGSRQ